jgi:hypothetical protein
VTDETARNNVVVTLKQMLSHINSCKTKFFEFDLFDEDDVSTDFYKEIARSNAGLLDVQCQYLKLATDLIENNDFEETFENEKDAILSERKLVFSEWKRNYQLLL